MPVSAQGTPYSQTRQILQKRRSYITCLNRTVAWCVVWALGEKNDEYEGRTYATTLTATPYLKLFADVTKSVTAKSCMLCQYYILVVYNTRYVVFQRPFARSQEPEANKSMASTLRASLFKRAQHCTYTGYQIQLELNKEQN